MKLQWEDKLSVEELYAMEYGDWICGILDRRRGEYKRI